MIEFFKQIRNTRLSQYTNNEDLIRLVKENEIRYYNDVIVEILLRNLKFFNTYKLKYRLITSDDFESNLLEVVSKAIKDFNYDKGYKFLTMCGTYLDRKLSYCSYEVTQDKRRTNTEKSYIQDLNENGQFENYIQGYGNDNEFMTERMNISSGIRMSKKFDNKEVDLLEKIMDGQIQFKEEIRDFFDYETRIKAETKIKNIRKKLIQDNILSR